MRTETSAQKFALLVGIDRYQGGIECLKNAVGDVRAVAKVLTELHGYQVQVVEDEQATLASLPKLLRALSSKLSPDTRFIFYFAGHGVAEDLFERGDGNEGFLLLSDTRTAASALLVRRVGWQIPPPTCATKSSQQTHFASGSARCPNACTFCWPGSPS